MSNIVFNYIVRDNINENRISDIVNGLESRKYKVHLRFFDFSLSKEVNKKVKSINKKPDNVTISAIEKDYEDFENASNLILENFSEYVDCMCLIIVYDNLVVNKSLDDIDFDLLQDDDFGFIYSDYAVNGIRCFLPSCKKTFELRSPFLFLSTKKIIKHISEKDPASVIYNKYAGFHIPKSLCNIVLSNEK